MSEVNKLTEYLTNFTSNTGLILKASNNGIFLLVNKQSYNGNYTIRFDYLQNKYILTKL